jgi:hypothetical protein
VNRTDTRSHYTRTVITADTGDSVLKHIYVLQAVLLVHADFSNSKYSLKTNLLSAAAHLPVLEDRFALVYLVNVTQSVTEHMQVAYSILNLVPSCTRHYMSVRNFANSLIRLDSAYL